MNDALAIWNAGLDAVRADRLLERRVAFEAGKLIVDDQSFDLHPKGKLIVVGAGKATVAMAVGLTKALSASRSDLAIRGWINVPEAIHGSDSLNRLIDSRITVCAARPWGVNEPTPLVVHGTNQIRSLVREALRWIQCFA